MNKAKSLNLCTNCLSSGHQIDTCRSSAYKKCSVKHNSLLHTDAQQQNVDNKTSDKVNVDNRGLGTQALSTFMPTNQVLLSTAIIQVRDSKGNFRPCRALLDSGSQSNFISKHFADNLGLQMTDINMTIVGITKLACKVKSKCELEMHSIHSNFKTTVSCLVVQSICDNAPSTPVGIESLDIPENLPLADPDFHTPKEIDLLIGASLFSQIICVGRITLDPSKPIIQLKSLCNFSQAPEVQDQDENGRFIVSHPLKEPTQGLGNSANQALKRFYNLERRLRQNPKLLDM
nr:unnamed protein product [Callosobruchus analis]